MERGEVWLADLDPIKVQNRREYAPLSFFRITPLTNLQQLLFAYHLLPLNAVQNCLRVQILKSESGLNQDSVALCHQMRVLDVSRLKRRLGLLNPNTLELLEPRVLFTLRPPPLSPPPVSPAQTTR